MSTRELFKAQGLPIFQNKMYVDQRSAIQSPTGDIVLVQNLETGLIYNTAFDVDLLAYDRDYQNEQAHSTVFQRHLNEVKKILDKLFTNKSAIEVGCGKGYFLEYLAEAGYEMTGVDPAYEGNNPKVIKTCFDKSLGFSAENIILRHVLEHMADPFNFLKSIALANDNKGKIYIEVPCMDWIVEHKAWFDIFYEHVNYFRLNDFYRMFQTIYESGHVFGGQYLYVVADL
jgi:SAM-dependent methyltransferase